MSRITYVNGRYVPSREAVVSVEDRGNQFADAVYEACQIKDGAIIDLRRHLDRLDRSLAELRIVAPMSRAAMTHVLREVARRNRVENGYVYWQISRGAAPRDHAFPAGVKPTFTATAKSLDVAAAALRYEKGVPVITLPDNRWERVDIKTVGLLPNALAKQTTQGNVSRSAAWSGIAATAAAASTPQRRISRRRWRATLLLACTRRTMRCNAPSGTGAIAKSAKWSRIPSNQGCAIKCAKSAACPCRRTRPPKWPAAGCTSGKLTPIRPSPWLTNARCNLAKSAFSSRSAENSGSGRKRSSR